MSITVQKPKVYVASRVTAASFWQSIRSQYADRVAIISTWIDEAGQGETLDHAELADRCIREAKSADAFLILPTQGIKGALIEMGAALAMDVPVYAAASTSEAITFLGNTLLHHKNVFTFLSVAECIGAITQDYKLRTERNFAHTKVADEKEAMEGIGQLRRKMFQVRSPASSA